MIRWILPAVLLLVILFVFLFRFGVLVRYDGTGPRVKLRLGPGYVQLWPSRTPPEKAEEKRRRKQEKREKKKEKKAAKRAKKPPKPKKKPSPESLLSLASELLPVIRAAGRRTRERIQIDSLLLHLIWGEEDPANAAVHYGQARAALEGLSAFLEGQSAISIKEKELSVDVDFVGEKPRLCAQAGLSMTIAQMTAIGVPAAAGAVGALLRWRKEQKPPKQRRAQGKEEVTHGKESSGK